MKLENHIIIRKATSTDVEPLANCLLLAMEDIVYKFIGKNNHDLALEFMHHFTQLEANQYSYQNCWVACIENKVVAAVNVYNGEEIYRLRKPVLEYLNTTFNRDFVPEDETQAGEFYIDTLGVLLEYQGKGIGSSLLQLLISEIVFQQGETLGLLVDVEKPQVKQLYLKLGFKSVGIKTLMGKPMEYMQIR
jgi:ribosomal protein S18 acetylase RimI-like enzyme